MKLKYNMIIHRNTSRFQPNYTIYPCTFHIPWQEINQDKWKGIAVITPFGP